MRLERQFMIREESLMVQLEEARKTAAYFAAENEMLRQKIAELLDCKVESGNGDNKGQQLENKRDDLESFFLFIPHKPTYGI